MGHKSPSHDSLLRQIRSPRWSRLVDLKRPQGRAQSITSGIEPGLAPALFRLAAMQTSDATGFESGEALQRLFSPDRSLPFAPTVGPALISMRESLGWGGSR
ncbi:hypothetical protein CDD83_2780 [Cordyceps sp. RAO-2017]|nr:hypothetical protein CDD83_2780 [Cordyceps sp. RAO-2017]